MFESNICYESLIINKIPTCIMLNFTGNNTMAKRRKEFKRIAESQ